MALVRYVSGRLLPQGLFDCLRQIALFAGAYYLYRIVRGQVDGEVSAAFENARSLVDIERGLHLFFEPGLQAWASGQEWIVHFASWMYVNTHFFITTTFLIWLYLRRNHAFYFVRNMFMIAMLLALVGYMVFPTAPPRFLPEWGFSDTVETFFGASISKGADALYNPFAAVPSMHVAFALMIGIPAIQLVRWRVVKILWGFYPVLVTFVVIVTGNHFWMDAFLGALVAGISAYAAKEGLGRARPEAWAWRRRLGGIEAAA
jgi:membrane-associated phospholipid phosphatase